MELGKVDLVTLGLLADGPAHGYQLLERARERRVARWARIGRASVYQALRRLERAGLIVGRDAPGVEGPERRVYRLTRTGRERLGRGLEALAREVGPYEAPGSVALGFLRLLGPARARAALAAREGALHDLALRLDAEARAAADPADRAMLGLQAALARAEVAWIASARRSLARAGRV
ncbi:MAG TPA: PadR family transcriptional regulator [Actinomycetota bacterium]|nr:PadR family transcriptional regulator [Actinomycetota bacterium]